MNIQVPYFFICFGLLCTTARLNTAHNGSFFNMISSTALTALGDTPVHANEYHNKVQPPPLPTNNPHYADRESAYSFRKFARFLVPFTTASTAVVALYQATSNPLLSTIIGIGLFPLAEELVSRATRNTSASNLSIIADNIHNQLQHSPRIRPLTAAVAPQSEPITMLSEGTNSIIEIEYKNNKPANLSSCVDTTYTITIIHDTIISRTIASLKKFKNWLF